MKQNSRRPLKKILLILLAAALLVKLFSIFSGLVEKVYSTGIYPVISTILRFITGWVPFSIGDVLYLLAIIWLLFRLVKLAVILLRVLFKRQGTWKNFWYRLGKTAIRILVIYIAFNLLWGLNYNRYGISYQLKLRQDKYSTEELKQLTAGLLRDVNASRLAVGDSNFVYPPYKTMFDSAYNAYQNAALTYPFLTYRDQSIKRSIYSELDNYFGFLGYYNPITAEAQVNTNVPPFVIPYTTCHEMAHQLGYGSESEANFVGYLSAISSKQAIFHYSAYFDLFNYANGELFMRDSAAARANYRALDTLVKRDYHIYRDYFRRYKNAMEPFIKLFYGEYLKANKQPKGIETYDEVVAWLIAYKKKVGKI